MKTFLRTLLYLSLIVWLGAEIFFPVVAAITFMTLRPDTHTAGTIVGQLLRILHGMGLVSGMVALALLALAPALGMYKPRAVLAPMALLVLMIALHGLLAVRHHSRDGAGPHCRWRSHRHADPANPTPWTSTSCTTAAKCGRSHSADGAGDGGAGGMGGDEKQAGEDQGYARSCQGSRWLRFAFAMPLIQLLR